jgi:TM2 domain-containing membrane protein YozV
MNEDKLPPETKRAIVGLVFWFLGWICVGAGVFYLIYLLRISLRRGRHH